MTEDLEEKRKRVQQQILKEINENIEKRYGVCTCDPDPQKRVICDACGRLELASKTGFSLRIW